MSGKLFISHSTEDDDFVRGLRMALAYHGQPGWIDSRELGGGDLLWPEIQKAIEEASAFAVLVSKNSLQSKWVGKEVTHALEIQKQRGGEFRVIPLSLDGTRLGVLEQLFGEEPVYIPVSSEAGGVEAAIHLILVALGKRLASDPAPVSQPQAEPVEDLVLELTDLKFHEEGGIRRASAKARLAYEPAMPGQSKVHSLQSWRLVAPMGPVEAGELRWYLEKYAIWPSHYFRPRAEKVEQDLLEWGKLLHHAAMPVAYRENVMSAWAKISPKAKRRFSVYVDASLEAGAPAEEVAASKEAATALLGLPWELLHDGATFFFQGARPTRVRRRVPATEALDVPVVDTPIRILLVTARPEDDACGYIDHRVSALPLVDAMESLPGLVKIHVLSPPTLPALRDELDRARSADEPYHVIHFDGHGAFDKPAGLGGLCFEHPQDSKKVDRRRHSLVTTNELGPLLRDHRIPLVFLEACQTAMSEGAAESVASELLKAGVASVVAMSHSVLVETARRFVECFYTALSSGARVGDAMLAGQRELKDNSFRGRVFGEGEFHLQDWFVPVLFQEKEDPQLFKSTPARRTVEDARTRLLARFGDLPPEPETGFVGRSRDLLALQRLLRQEKYVVVRGQGGEGKTALAAEFARWMVRSHQTDRVVFVSVETQSNLAAVIDSVGRQLIGKEYSVATFASLEAATLPIERVLEEQAVLLVVDNMESILLPPFLAAQTPQSLSESALQELGAIIELCSRLNSKGATRMVFTSREALPSPFNAVWCRRELHQLAREDAVRLTERALNLSAGEKDASVDTSFEQIESLVDAVNCHARTLALLAPAIRSRGVVRTRESLIELMGEMDRMFPGNREKSLFASIELSLRRLSPINRERALVLGVFQGGFDLEMLRKMMGWTKGGVESLAVELVETGLATPNPFDYFTLHPALCPYLRRLLVDEQRQDLATKWGREMRREIWLLVQKQRHDAESAAALTLLDLPNIFTLLEHVVSSGDHADAINLTTSLRSLLQRLNKPKLLKYVDEALDRAAENLNEGWSHERFEAERGKIERLQDSGKLTEALGAAEKLLRRAQAVGELAYPAAGYDLAMAFNLLGQVRNSLGDQEQALTLLDKACEGFMEVEKKYPNKGAGHMFSGCAASRSHIFFKLGRFSEAEDLCEKAIQIAVKFKDVRQVASVRFQLGQIWMFQCRYVEALTCFSEAREQFSRLRELGSVAKTWYQTGMAQMRFGEMDEAGNGFRESLRISVQIGDVAGQAGALFMLGQLHLSHLRLFEEARDYYTQAIAKKISMEDSVGECRARGGLAAALASLGLLDSARKEVRNAIELGGRLGSVVSPWQYWNTLAKIEMAAGDLVAAEGARRNSTALYLEYRQGGGRNYSGSGEIALVSTQYLLGGEPRRAADFLRDQADDPSMEDILPFIGFLQKIVAGSRDRRMADDPQLDCEMSAEILIMIESLEKLNIHPSSG